MDAQHSRLCCNTVVLVVTAISLTGQWLSIRVSLCCGVGAGKFLFIEISRVSILSCLIPDAIIVQSSVLLSVAMFQFTNKKKSQIKNRMTTSFNIFYLQSTLTKVIVETHIIKIFIIIFLSNQPQRIDRWKWNLPVFLKKHFDIFFTAIAECQWKSWSFDRMKKYICGKFWLHQKKKRFGFFFGKSLFLSSPIFSDSTEIPTIFRDPKNGRLTS